MFHRMPTNTGKSIDRAIMLVVKFLPVLSAWDEKCSYMRLFKTNLKILAANATDCNAFPLEVTRNISNLSWISERYLKYEEHF